MTLKEFKRYAAVHGANLDRWPPQVAPEALALLDDSEEARRELGDAAITDQLLNAATAPDLSDEREQRVYDRIFERLAERTVPEFVPWFLAKSPLRAAPTAGFLAAMAVLGFLTYNQAVLPFQRTNSLDLSGAMIVSSYLGETR
ncbi:hypothetical protein [Azospirillum doebereinerae]|uniref:Uncharacterized protein n=1 Tax=Azospirillum doebereinerae TaxID=92933 RepID=A0A433JDC5_9PROT|nr:hypothetical protein [Azospirillum doebereinerae]MCG5238521.1 hypothetical protein [Azospirillum doebereinerae]RUQ74598.1 hypothetical protein EJ913_06040 [Azospirillum doebereinerae]